RTDACQIQPSSVTSCQAPWRLPRMSGVPCWIVARMAPSGAARSSSPPLVTVPACANAAAGQRRSETKPRRRSIRGTAWRPYGYSVAWEPRTTVWGCQFAHGRPLACAPGRVYLDAPSAYPSCTIRDRMTSKQRLRRMLATVSAVALLATPAAGQTIRSPYRHLEHSQAGGLFVGYVVTDRGSLELGPGSAPVFGARYGIRLSGPFTVEGEAAFVPTSRRVVDLETDEEGDTHMPVRLRNADISLLVLSGALRFNLTGPRTYR